MIFIVKKSRAEYEFSSTKLRFFDIKYEFSCLKIT